MYVLLTAMFDYLRFLLNRSTLSENDFADFISLNNFSKQAKQNSETDACMQKIGRNYFRKKSHHGRNLCRVGSLASMFIARCVHVLTYKHATKTVILATIFGHPSDNNNIVSHSRYFSFVQCVVYKKPQKFTVKQFSLLFSPFFMVRRMPISL